MVLTAHLKPELIIMLFKRKSTEWSICLDNQISAIFQILILSININQSFIKADLSCHNNQSLIARALKTILSQKIVL